MVGQFSLYLLGKHLKTTVGFDLGTKNVFHHRLLNFYDDKASLEN